ncbi:hypothetical protein Hanom_Chr09g00822381 [Helianthus anomalus]
MQHQVDTDDLGFCLSFSCYYSSDTNLIASAAAKVICELKQEHAPHLYEEEFEFSPDDDDGKQIDDFGFIFPVFDDEETRDAAASPVSVQLQKSSVHEHESYSSSEADENECNCKPSGIFCLWSLFEKSKKSSSTGSSRSWGIWNSPRRRNCQGEESVLLLRSKKADASKDRGQVPRKLKTTKSVHEVFYLQKRAEQKGDKMKSFLPYKQDLFVNINRFANKKLSSV